MMRRLRERTLVSWIQQGLIVLVAVMPLHAFLSVWLGHLFGHETLWQSWKELLILLMVAGSSIVAWRDHERLRRLATPMNYLFAGFILIGLLVSAFQIGSLTVAGFGIKTDFEFLAVGLVAQLVGDAALVRRLIRAFLVSCTIVIGFGLLQVYALPHDWLVQFGYGVDTIQPYSMVDPAVDSVRILSTLGGPNQLGSFLILPLCLLIWGLLTRPRWWQALLVVGAGVVMWHTYGRAAQLGFGVALLVLILMRLPRRWRIGAFTAAAVVAIAGGGLLAHGVNNHRTLQYYVLHESTQKTGISASTDQHKQALEHGLSVVRDHPLGLGLGSAGPASFHSDSPLIPESYYLQIAIETGVVGLLAFLGGQVLLGLQLLRISSQSDTSHNLTRLSAAACCAALVGMAVVNLFLHGWTDSSTALTFWALAGAVVGSKA